MLREAQARYPKATIGIRVGRVWRISEAELRRYLPTLFGGGGMDEIESRTRAHLRAIDQRIETRAEAVCLPLIAAEREAREEGVQRIAELCAQVAEGVAKLAHRVARLEGRH
jgi:hypothetical protein